MSTAAIIAIIVLAVVVLLVVGGLAGNARLRRAREADFEESLDEVNRQLAAAHAQDKGWEPRALEDAARRAFAQARPGDEVRQQALVQVVDRPGTDEDKAIFRFLTDTGAAYLTLGRVGGEWVAEDVEAR
jgi:hypothetical protein